MTELELKHLASERIAKLNAEQRILLSESTSASFASPNKAVVQSPDKYFDNLLYGVEPMSPLWFELVQVKGSAEYAEWMSTNNPLEWYGEFKRTRHEQMNIESYNEKDLV